MCRNSSDGKSDTSGATFFLFSKKNHAPSGLYMALDHCSGMKLSDLVVINVVSQMQHAVSNLKGGPQHPGD